ncbi:MAG TPA: glycerate kinase [Gaiellaceae bacterium]|nr:glycerate kinase [Gaiellaceae bacterium]
MLALASPASLKGVLSARQAAELLTRGLERGGVDALALPVADGGEGLCEVVHAALGGEWRAARVPDPLGRPVEAAWLELPDGTALVESAQAVGLPLLGEGELDPLHASSRGLGELLRAVLAKHPARMIVGLGGTATVDGGAGLLGALGALPAGLEVRAACDVTSPLLGSDGAAHAFGPQKGAGPEEVDELERRLAARDDLAPYRDLPGAGAGGGLGAAFASLGARLVRGAPLVLDLVGFDARARDAALVVTGEGAVDRTTLAGKAPGVIRERCRELGVDCVVFGGLVRDDIDAIPLSGDPARAARDVEALGEELARSLVERA